MPDEAQQPEPDAQPATPRRTAMQVAEAAREIAEGARTEADNAVGMFDTLSEKVTDLDTRLRDGLELVASNVEPSSIEELRGQIQGLREEFGGFAGAVNRKQDEIRLRLASAEDELKRLDADPAGATMAEDHVSDVVERLFTQRMDGVLARLEHAERNAQGGDGTPGMTWDAIAQRVDAQAKTALREAVASGTIVPNYATGTAPTRTAGVHAKVLQVMRDVGAIGKDRQMNQPGQRYAYRGIDDAMDAVGHAMREVGLVYTTEIVNREVSRDEAQNKEGRTLLWTSVMLTVRYTFIDPVDGSTQTFEMAGEGRASDDKATSKAAAMALKYGLLHALMIPVSGAIPDGDAESPQVTRDGDRSPAEEDTRTDQQRAARAVDAVRAIQNLHRHPLEKRYEVLVGIRNQASREGLLGIQVDTGDGPAPVEAYATAALRTMQQQANQESGQPSGAF